MVPSSPHILAIISDLFFTSRVGSVADELGCRVTWVESASAYADADTFVATLAADPPALILLDLNASMPWHAWLTAAKSGVDTASIPWLAFGSHKASETLARAKQAGADRVVAKSKFTGELPELMRSFVFPS